MLANALARNAVTVSVQTANATFIEVVISLTAAVHLTTFPLSAT